MGWALVYAFYIHGRLPGPGWLQGLLSVGMGGFLISSLVVLPVLGWIHPLARAARIPAPGVFGLGFVSGRAVVGNLLGHCLYGLTLGILYRRRLIF
jgi:hypothetical protein